MKIARIVSFLAAVATVALAACSNPPAENAERTAACKDSGNQKMCGVCCNTKTSTFTNKGMTGTCACFGDVEK